MTKMAFISFLKKIQLILRRFREDSMAWSFKSAVSKFYKNAEFHENSLKEIYNGGKSKDLTCGKAVYALYLDGELMKIGKAVHGQGLFTRMSQYYRLDKAGCEMIDTSNEDKIKVEYFFLPSGEECWAAERRLQVEAWDNSETMPWEDKTRN